MSQRVLCLRQSTLERKNIMSANNYQRQISWYRSRIRTLSSQKETAEAEVSDLEDKIARLRAAYKALGKQKEDLAPVKREIEAVYENPYNWQGRRFDEFATNASNHMAANNIFYAELDRIQDEVNWRLTEYENQANEKYWLIGSLKSSLNNCWTWLQNHTN